MYIDEMVSSRSGKLIQYDLKLKLILKVIATEHDSSASGGVASLAANEHLVATGDWKGRLMVYKIVSDMTKVFETT